MHSRHLLPLQRPFRLYRNRKPVAVRRSTDGRHILTVEAPLRVEKTADKAGDILRTTQDINRRIEAWIRRYPEDW
ncbi:MAG: hypothetical protein ACFNYJ_03230, partial [Segatella oris]